VRAGLVVLGIVIGTVGAGVLGAAFFLPPTTTQTQLGSVTVTNLGADLSHNSLLSGTNVSSGTFAISWTSTSTISAAIYRSAPCATPPALCPVGSPLVKWNANQSGRWLYQGSLTFPLVLSIANPGPSMTTLQGTLVELYPAGGLPTWALLSIIAGGGILVGIGGLAIFLGLFLRGGIYTQPGRAVPRAPAVNPGEPMSGEPPTGGRP
jgi:hypothetical protein